MVSVADFRTKLLSGEPTSPQEWQDHLREFHGREPGAASALCSGPATSRGQTSYDVLADTVAATADVLGRPVDVLDLACGDGFLIEVCLRQFSESIDTITGVDMSEDELEAARQRLEGGPARLHVGLAESLPLATGSVDVALCHAAFMLMIPIEPVVAELARVLRPGGIFSAVVASMSASAGMGGPGVGPQRELWIRTSAALRQFWQDEYPGLQMEGRVGDGRAMTEDGWRELFNPTAGFTGDVEVEEFEVIVDGVAEDIWSFFERSYLVEMLDADNRDRLRSRLIAVITEHERAHGACGMTFPERKLSVRRL